MDPESTTLTDLRPSTPEAACPTNCYKGNHLSCKLLQSTLLNPSDIYEGWNFNSGNYLFTTDTK